MTDEQAEAELARRAALLALRGAVPTPTNPSAGVLRQPTVINVRERNERYRLLLAACMALHERSPSNIWMFTHDRYRVASGAGASDEATAWWFTRQHAIHLYDQMQTRKASARDWLLVLRRVDRAGWTTPRRKVERKRRRR